MIWLIMLIGLLILVCSYLLFKNPCSPAFIFTSLWILITSLASLSLFGFNGYSEKSVFQIFVGMISFAAGALLIDLKKRNVLLGVKNVKHKKLYLNTRLLNFVLVLVCIGSLASLYYSLHAYSSGSSLSDVRGSLMGYNDNQLISNSFLSGFINYFVGPAKKVLIPIAVYYFFKRKNMKFVLITFATVVSDAISSGGRIMILYTVLMFVVAFFYFRDSISVGSKRKILFIAVAGLVALIFMTAIRSSSSVLRSIYSYFSISVPLLEKYSTSFENADFYAFGGATFYPFLYCIKFLTNIFNVNSEYLDSLSTYVAYPQDTWVRGLFPTGDFNAFSSLFYYFYMDFRIWGIIIFSFIYGFVCNYIYVKAFVERSDLSFLLYLMIVQSLFGSFIIWQIGNTKFFVALLILIVLRLKVKNFNRFIRLGAKH